MHIDPYIVLGSAIIGLLALTIAAALGALIFGHVVVDVTASLIIGSVPAVLVGSMLSSTVLGSRRARPAERSRGGGGQPLHDRDGRHRSRRGG